MSKKPPKPEEVYESAWAAFRKETYCHKLEDLHKEGWRCYLDFPDIPKQQLKNMMPPGRFEKQIFKVFTTGKTREVNFWRPRV